MPRLTLQQIPLFHAQSRLLLDSGSSAHMCKDLNMLVEEARESFMFVKLANGVIVRSPKMGTCKVRIQDKDTHEFVDVMLDNTLFVPGLTENLFSVTQWTKNGGRITFSPGNVAIEIEDATSGRTHKFNVNPPFSRQATPSHADSANSRRSRWCDCGQATRRCDTARRGHFVCQAHGEWQHRKTC